MLEENRTDEVLIEMSKILPQFLAGNYEKIAVEILQTAINNKKIPLNFERCGRWWDKNEEIDVVATNSRTNEILFGEVKWTNKKIGTNIYEDLKRKSQIVDWGKVKQKKYFALFSKKGFTENMIKLAKKEKIYLFTKDVLT
ncbi:DUF234 domain-containing protein [bacterium]|nr:DUF234 domain-containing protein [bacterium]MBU4134307.1 DUF234 domain-containing protein [bacterium]